ncbi:MAG: hypothetical protein V2B19_31765 [Pseudomonadota bacterium]
MNPFKILDVDAGASQKDIIQAVARAMREKIYPGRELAMAQQLLLDPVTRATQEFLHVLDLKLLLDTLPLERPPAIGQDDRLPLICLDVFDGEE